MNLLLDTHILLWWLGGSPRLSKKAKTAIEGAETAWVSAATGWEIETKRARGRLEAPENLEETLRAGNFLLLPLSMAHAIAAARLPMFHRDPFDRMLVAQAGIESLVLLTADRQLEAYDVPVIVA